MRIKIWIILSCFLLLAGCSSDKKVLENLGFVRTITFDTIDGEDPHKLIDIGFSIPLSTVEDNILFTTHSHTSKQARAMFTLQNDRKIVSGQLRQVLFGSELAKHGIWSHLDSMLRDPTIGRKVHVVMVDDKALPLLEKKYIQDPTSGKYIDDLLERAMELTNIPVANLHTFSRDYHDDGIDPAIPIIKLEKQYLRIVGIAFFQDDRYVAHIPQNLNLIFSALGHNLKTGELTIKIPENDDGGGDIILGYFNSKRKIKVNRSGPITDGENIKVDINVTLKGSLLDYTGNLNLAKVDNQKKAEQLMIDYIEQKALEIIKTTQEHKVDPIGIGQFVRNTLTYDEWKDLTWHEVYPNIKVNVNVEVLVKEYGKMQ